MAWRGLHTIHATHVEFRSDEGMNPMLLITWGQAEQQTSVARHINGVALETSGYTCDGIEICESKRAQYARVRASLIILAYEKL